MRHTRLFRLMATLFGVWFTFTLVQPNGIMGLTMSGSGASMNMTMASMTPTLTMTSAVAATAQATLAQRPAASEEPAMDLSAGHMADMHHASAGHVAQDGAPKHSNTTPECDQHDCCCSALSTIALLPVAALAWLPEEIVNAVPPRTGDCVAHTDGQLRLPFANGPPRTVTA